MELSVSEYYEKFSLCAIDHDLPAIVRIRDDLIKQRQKMDRWFDKYLDMFDRKMDPAKCDTPEWKLYHKKSEEYSTLNSLIKSADQYVKKVSANV
jgi:hypothetical protein